MEWWTWGLNPDNLTSNNNVLTPIQLWCCKWTGLWISTALLSHPECLLTQIPGPQHSGPGRAWEFARLTFPTSSRQVPALGAAEPQASLWVALHSGVRTVTLPHRPCCITVKDQIRELKSKTFLFSLNATGNHRTKSERKKHEHLLIHINMYVYVSYVLNVFFILQRKLVSF